MSDLFADVVYPLKLTEPANNSADNVASRKTNVEVERGNWRKSSLLKEDDGEAKNGVAAQNLRSPDDDILRDHQRISRTLMKNHLQSQYDASWYP